MDIWVRWKCYQYWWVDLWKIHSKKDLGWHPPCLGSVQIASRVIRWSVNKYGSSNFSHVPRHKLLLLYFNYIAYSCRTDFLHYDWCFFVCTKNKERFDDLGSSFNGCCGWFVGNVISKLWRNFCILAPYLELALFTALVAHDTRIALERYKAGDPDHIVCATDLFLHFSNLFLRFVEALLSLKKWVSFAYANYPTKLISLPFLCKKTIKLAVEMTPKKFIIQFLIACYARYSFSTFNKNCSK